MGVSLGGKNDGPIADINVTPFVDIILVVLIIFMVTTPIIMKPSINVQLPKAASGEQSTATQLNITVSKTGELMLNGKATNEQELAVASKELLNANPEIQAVIAADQETSHGKVVSIIDIIKSVGVRKFAISIDKK
jgi:biopolymer transport protein ExbD